MQKESQLLQGRVIPEQPFFSSNTQDVFEEFESQKNLLGRKVNFPVRASDGDTIFKYFAHWEFFER